MAKSTENEPKPETTRARKARAAAAASAKKKKEAAEKKTKQSRTPASAGWKEKKAQINKRAKEPKTLAERKAYRENGPIKRFFMSKVGFLDMFAVLPFAFSILSAFTGWAFSLIHARCRASAKEISSSFRNSLQALVITSDRLYFMMNLLTSCPPKRD